jgi:hypothetical protein
MQARGMKITNFHFTHAIPKPDPALRDYPKWVYMEGFPGTIARNEREEQALLARTSPGEKIMAGSDEPPPAAAPKRVLVGSDTDEREILLQVLRERGVKTDGRWRTERLRAEVARLPEPDGA